MNVLIIGYGKMGRAIEAHARERGHEIVGIIDVQNAEELEKFDGTKVDVAIEFTQPGVAMGNYEYCLRNAIKVVTGTTGWTEQTEKVRQLCQENNGTFLFSSNFSLGVNLFFQLNRYLASLMKDQGYEVDMREIHHIHKKDAPSGTAITLADGILEVRPDLSAWKLNGGEDHELSIHSEREGEVPGTHIIRYRSPSDEIEIKHEAFNRDGFVHGAVRVAEWIKDQQGFLEMSHFLKATTNFE